MAVKKVILDDLMSIAQDLMLYFHTRYQLSSQQYFSISPPKSNPVSSPENMHDRRPRVGLESLTSRFALHYVVLAVEL